MTVQITKRGKLPSEKKYDLRCGRCGTEFTCQQRDLTPSRDPRGSDEWSVNCPLPSCDGIVWVCR